MEHDGERRAELAYTRGLDGDEWINMCLVLRHFPASRYSVRAHLISSTISQHGSAWIMEVRPKGDSGLQTLCVTGTSTRTLERRLEQKEQLSCAICNSNKIKNISCNFCGKDMCMTCFIGVLRSREGQFKCPFCRGTFGIPNRTQAEVDYIVRVIESKFE